MTSDDEVRMRDVDHQPPDGDGAKAVWERGGEETPDDDESDPAAETTPADGETTQRAGDAERVADE